MNKTTIEEKLATYFFRNGCQRKPNKDRHEEGNKNYKRGWEIRLTANDEAEVTEIRDLLKASGFSPGKPYSKHLQTILPLYGRETSEKFIELLSRVVKSRAKSAEKNVK